MNQPVAPKLSKRRTATRPYGNIPLLSLLRLIREEGSRDALDELHTHRSVFRIEGGPPQLLFEFLGNLRDSPAPRRLARFRMPILERAYDLTIDKFTILPNPDDPLKRNGPDCRLYFGAVVDRVLAERQAGVRMGLLAEEATVARLLQGQVTRHFGYSCLEARRESDEARSRYTWYVNGGAIPLRFPLSISGLDRRAWLEDHVPDPDPRRANESQRVQEIVDRLLGVPGSIPFGSLVREVADERAPNADLQWLLEYELTTVGLGALVADEKCRNLPTLRPAIRALGDKKLRQLILRVFEELGDGTFHDTALARDFGVSKATLSRFLGNRSAVGSDSSIGDLWRNTAQVLASTPAFIEAAQVAGVWSRVVSLIDGQSREVTR